MARRSGLVAAARRAATVTSGGGSGRCPRLVPHFERGRYACLSCARHKHLPGYAHRYCPGCICEHLSGAMLNKSWLPGEKRAPYIVCGGTRRTQKPGHQGHTECCCTHRSPSPALAIPLVSRQWRAEGRGAHSHHTPHPQTRFCFGTNRTHRFATARFRGWKSAVQCKTRSVSSQEACGTITCLPEEHSPIKQAHNQEPTMNGVSPSPSGDGDICHLS